MDGLGIESTTGVRPRGLSVSRTGRDSAAHDRAVAARYRTLTREEGERLRRLDPRREAGVALAVVAAGVRQREVAEAMGISPSALCRWLRRARDRAARQQTGDASSSHGWLSARDDGTVAARAAVHSDPRCPIVMRDGMAVREVILDAFQPPPGGPPRWCMVAGSGRRPRCKACWPQ